jgi:hypothetical protein
MGSSRAALLTLIVATGWFPRMGCHQVSEYDSYGEYGVGVLSLPDLVEEGEIIQGFDGGRCICPLESDEFLVSCTTGQLFLASTDERAILDVYALGQPFASGYGDMILADNGRVYLISDFGQLLEFSTSVGAVMAKFSAGPQPVSLCLSSDPERFFVGDGLDNTVREVAIPENLVVRERLLECPPTAMALSLDEGGTLAVVSAEEDALLYFIDIGSMLYPYDFMSGLAAADAGSLEDTLVVCVANPGYELPSGSVDILAFGHFPDTLTSRRVYLEGHPASVAADDYRNAFYVASHLEGGSSRVYSIDGYSGIITATADIPGYVWDISVNYGFDLLIYLTSSV